MAVRLARLFLLVALLAGWQSAFVHPIEHVDGQGQLVHVGEGSQSSDLSCDLLDALTACAPQAASVVPVFPSSFQSLLYPVRAPRIAEAPPFLSQGPPAAV